MPDINEIKLKFFHICENIIIQEETKNISIINDFDSTAFKRPVNADENTKYVKKFVIAVNFYGPPGSYETKLEIYGTQSEAQHTIPTAAEIGDDGNSIGVNIFTAINFENEGDHRFSFKVKRSDEANFVEIGYRFMTVKFIDATD